MAFIKNQKSSINTKNLKRGEKITTASSSKLGPDVNKKSFLDITTLIRSIQRAEGNTDCFQKGIVDCDQLDCKWRSFCLEEQPVLRKNEAQIERRYIMKAGIFFTGTGPILILTTYESLNDSKLIEKLAVKGIKKFIAYEIPEEKVQEKYGLQFKTILSDLRQTDDLRVLDYDGHHIFNSISFRELGEPIFYEA